MGLKLKHERLAYSYIFCLAIVGLVSCNIDQDRAECTDQVVGLATCLTYVEGQAKAPTPDCCSGLKMVIQKSKKCLCILIKDRDDPSLGLKINLTLALELPTTCHSPTNISECIDLLHLPPNSKEAKDFLEGVKGGNAPSSAAPVTGDSNKNGQKTEDQKSGGDGDGMKRRLSRFEVETLIWFFVSLLIFTHI